MLKLVYRENSESASAAENFMRDFKAQTGREIETINPDDAAGQRFIEAYDIVEYPTLIAIGFDGWNLHVGAGICRQSATQVFY